MIKFWNKERSLINLCAIWLDVWRNRVGLKKRKGKTKYKKKTETKSQTCSQVFLFHCNTNRKNQRSACGTEKLKKKTNFQNLLFLLIDTHNNISVSSQIWSTMNIFRLAGDMTHLASVLVLLLKIHTIKSCAGNISLHISFFFLWVFCKFWILGSGFWILFDLWVECIVCLLNWIQEL